MKTKSCFYSVETIPHITYIRATSDEDWANERLDQYYQVRILDMSSEQFYKHCTKLSNMAGIPNCLGLMLINCDDTNISPKMVGSGKLCEGGCRPHGDCPAGTCRPAQDIKVGVI